MIIDILYNLPVEPALPQQQTVVLSVPFVDQLILCYCTVL